MKVLMINGSSNENGCTFRALSEIAHVLNKEQIETEIIQLGDNAYRDCTGCGVCRKLKNMKCVHEDIVNQIIEKAKTSDGFVFGSPVYYAHPSGRLLSVLDRVFFAGGSAFEFKPGAAIVSARRAGTTASLDVLNKYFMINKMPVISSTYWNMVHGRAKEDVEKDFEGLQTMQNLAKNMAFYLKNMSGKEFPENEKKEVTSFIR